MIEFGKTLREAREAKGYSVSQLAEITHILPQIIENFEKEDFTRIVAPIYGRGFVKLYCEAVGLDPQPLVAEFMEIYSGNRPPVIRLKETETPAPEPMATPIGNAQATEESPPPVALVAEEEPPVAEEEPPVAEKPALPAEPAAEVPPPASEPMSFDFDPLPEPPPVAREPLARPVREPAPFKPGPDDLPFPDEPLEQKRDYRLPGYSMPDVPRRFWRFGILIAAAAIILAVLFFSCRAVYRATMQVPEESEEEKVKVKGEDEQWNDKLPNTQTSNAKPQTSKLKTQTLRAPRKPIAVPPLYID